MPNFDSRNLAELAFNNTVDQKVDHLFRIESGRMVSVLVKIFGSQHLELAEDVVQSTLIKALETWKYKGIPDNPKAWLYRVAKNNTIDIIRKEKRNTSFDFSDPNGQLLLSEYSINPTMNALWDENRIKDDFLGMMFACCNPKISSENQITFILKILCGFSTKEVAKAFLTSEDIISKRIYRTKEYFRENNLKPNLDSVNITENSIKSVANAIYLIFNEGYSSTSSDAVIRKDLVSQALFLTRELLNNKKTALPEINALMALMCFHASRMDSRVSETGDLIRLKDQDRSLWNKDMIAIGRDFLIKSGSGNRISFFHFEAFIAMEHCNASSYEETNWSNILNFYNQMLEIKDDPVISLNRSLVILQENGPKAALKDIEHLSDNKQMQKYYLYHAALGEIHKQLKDDENAYLHFSRAKSLTKSKNEQRFLQSQMDLVNPKI